MKIHNNLPISGNQTRKSGKSRSGSVFHTLFEAEVTDVQTTGEQQAPDERNSQDQAWRALEDSVFLLDEAMQCLESGQAPTQQLVDSIDQLRTALHQQLASGSDTRDLTQAEILLAVEVERMRAMQS